MKSIQCVLLRVVSILVLYCSMPFQQAALAGCPYDCDFCPDPPGECCSTDIGPFNETVTTFDLAQGLGAYSYTTPFDAGSQYSATFVVHGLDCCEYARFACKVSEDTARCYDSWWGHSGGRIFTRTRGCQPGESLAVKLESIILAEGTVTITKKSVPVASSSSGSSGSTTTSSAANHLPTVAPFGTLFAALAMLF